MKKLNNYPFEIISVIKKEKQGIFYVLEDKDHKRKLISSKILQKSFSNLIIDFYDKKFQSIQNFVK